MPLQRSYKRLDIGRAVRYNYSTINTTNNQNFFPNYSKAYNYLYTHKMARILEETPKQKPPRQRWWGLFPNEL